MTLYQDGQPEPIAIQMVGGGWVTFWLRIDMEAGEIEMWSSTRQDLNSWRGLLTGDSPKIRLAFNRNGLMRSYFKVIDPDSNAPIGNARCLKETARKIVDIQMRQSKPKGVAPEAMLAAQRPTNATPTAKPDLEREYDELAAARLKNNPRIIETPYEFAAHVVRSVIFSAGIVGSLIGEDCPEFKEMFGEGDSWTKVWFAIYVHTLLMLYGPKISPEEHKKLYIAFCHVAEKAPRLGSAANECRHEFAQYVKNHNGPIEEITGLWVLEKAGLGPDFVKSDGFVTAFGNAIFAALAPEMSTVRSFPDWRG